MYYFRQSEGQYGPLVRLLTWKMGALDSVSCCTWSSFLTLGKSPTFSESLLSAVNKEGIFLPLTRVNKIMLNVVSCLEATLIGITYLVFMYQTGFAKQIYLKTVWENIKVFRRNNLQKTLWIILLHTLKMWKRKKNKSHSRKVILA